MKKAAEAMGIDTENYKETEANKAQYTFFYLIS